MVASTDPRMSMPNAGSTKFARTTYATPSVIMIRKLVISSNPIPFIFFSIWVFSPEEEKTQMLKKMKGIGLLLITNFLIMITLGVAYVVLANFVLPAFGIDIRGSVDATILLYAGVLGFGGAFISLAFSKQFARAMLDCYQLTE